MISLSNKTQRETLCCVSCTLPHIQQMISLHQFIFFSQTRKHQHWTQLLSTLTTTQTISTPCVYTCFHMSIARAVQHITIEEVTTNKQMCVITCNISWNDYSSSCLLWAQCTSAAQTAESAWSAARGKNALPFKLMQKFTGGGERENANSLLSRPQEMEEMTC